MKQIGLGLLQYTQDYDESLPIGINVKGAADWPLDNRGGWAGQIYPYVKSAQVFACPSDSKGNVSYGYNGAIPYSASNSFGAGVSQIARFNAPAKTVMLFEVTGVNVPASRLAMDDEGFSLAANRVNFSTQYSPTGMGVGVGNGEPSGLYGNGGGSGGNGKYATGNLGGRNLQGSTAGAGQQPVTGRHLEGSNFLAADGHVKWLKHQNISCGVKASASTDAQGATAGGTGLSAGTSAAGTDSMATPLGEAALTFSPV